MSRIGNRIITIPASVTINVDGNKVVVKGPKGELSTEINKNLNVNIEGTELTVSCGKEAYKQFHGTANANIKNMIVGVSEGFTKQLETQGVGYRFQVNGKQLVVTAGFSHPVKVEIPKELTVEAPSNTELTIKGIDKCLVGEFAANVRKIRRPEPYKGKGIRYKGEIVRRKEGKKAA